MTLNNQRVALVWCFLRARAALRAGCHALKWGCAGGWLSSRALQCHKSVCRLWSLPFQQLP